MTVLGIETSCDETAAAVVRDAREVVSSVVFTNTRTKDDLTVSKTVTEGITGDYSMLAAKGVADGIIIMIMSTTMGKGCIFSAIPVAILQGGVTALSWVIRPLMTEAALGNLSLIGSILIFCVGLNLVWGKKLRVANMLPAVVLAVVVAFLPF